MDCNMKRCSIQITSLVLAAVTLGSSISVVAADNSQKNKNNWRNAAIAGGAVALYGLNKHDTTTTVLGAAGAAYSANRYEKDRKNQASASRNRARYHRSSRNYTSKGRQYYYYQGHTYYKNVNTGQRHLVK